MSFEDKSVEAKVMRILRVAVQKWLRTKKLFRFQAAPTCEFKGVKKVAERKTIEQK